MDKIVFASEHITRIIAALKKVDINIEFGSDFHYYKDNVISKRLNVDIAPPFDCNKHYLTQANSFWMIGKDENGDLVHTQALKRIEIHDTNLVNYLKAFYSDFSPAGFDIDYSNSSFAFSPGTKAIRGDVFYHGDLWLYDAPRYRGNNTNSLLTLLSVILTYIRWSPNFVFGFVPDILAYGGLGARESYLHAEPGVVNWKMINGDNLSGFIVWNSKEDLEYIIEQGIDRWL